MARRILQGILLGAIACCLSLVSLAQDTQKAEGKKSEKMAMKSITCSPDCGFMVRSHDEQEVVDVAMKHAKAKHDMDMTTAEAKKMMKSETVAVKEGKKAAKKEVKKEEK